MPFPNKFQVKCETCGTEVPTGMGWTEGPPWKNWCQACSGVIPANYTKPKVSVQPNGDKAHFKPVGRLNDHFNTYRECCFGSVWNPTLQANLAALDKATGIIQRLQANGFQVEVNPDLAARLQALTSQTKLDIAEATQRSAKVAEELKARGLELYPYQQLGVEWLASKHGALLADDMGLGKTIQALLALPAGVPVLVVGTAITKGVWAYETKKWRPDLDVSVIEGKKFRTPYPNDLVITTYDSVPDDAGLHENTVVIADEAQALKNPKTKRSKRFRALASAARDKGGRTWLISATPLENKPPELWSLLQAAGVAQEAFGGWRGFTRAFNGSEGRYHMEWGEPTPEAGKLLQRVMLRRLKVDVLPELPIKTYQTVMVEITKATRKSADSLAEYFKLQRPTVWDHLLGDEADPRPEPKLTEADVNEALDVANTVMTGRSFNKLAQVRAALAKAKTPTMLGLVEKCEEVGEPLIVFSAHLSPIEVLKEREGWGVITGATPPRERTAIAEAFQAGQLRGVGASIKAGGSAITLTRASRSIFVDREWNPAANSQAEGRNNRIGQTRGCVITDLVAEHWLDKRLHALLLRKQTLIADSVDEARQQAVAEFDRSVIEVDFEALALEAEIESKALDQAQAEAEALAAQRKEYYASITEELTQQKAEDAVKAKRDILERQARQNALERGWLAPVGDPSRHAAVTDQEAWAEQALERLSALDPDRATETNGVGFNKADGYVGHYLVPEVALGLTPGQWELAIKICRKYHGQIGACP